FRSRSEKRRFEGRLSEQEDAGRLFHFFCQADDFPVARSPQPLDDYVQSPDFKEGLLRQARAQSGFDLQQQRYIVGGRGGQNVPFLHPIEFIEADDKCVVLLVLLRELTDDHRFCAEYPAIPLPLLSGFDQLIVREFLVGIAQPIPFFRAFASGRNQVRFFLRRFVRIIAQVNLHVFEFTVYHRTFASLLGIGPRVAPGLFAKIPQSVERRRRKKMYQSREDLAPEKFVVSFQERNQRRHGAQIFILIQGINGNVDFLRIVRAQAGDQEVVILRVAVESEIANRLKTSFSRPPGRDLSDARQCFEFVSPDQQKYRRFEIGRIR